MDRFIGLGAILLLHNVCFSYALFEGCDHTYNLNPNSVAYLQSPYYPNKYPSGTSCRYKLIAPLDYEILAECSISIDKSTDACSTEHFYISTDGVSTLTGAEEFCGNGNVARTSLFRTIVIAYVSAAMSNSQSGGVFNCKLTTRPQACNCGWSVNTRIVGGVDATVGEFPSIVALFHGPSQTLFCDGIIISHSVVLTAAHCTRLYPNVNDILVIAGDHDLSTATDTPYAATYGVSSFVEHSGYNATTNVNDLAILFLSSNIEWSRGVGPICLPLDQITNTFDYANVNLVGWGTTSFAGPRSSILQKATVNVLPNSACQSVYPTLQSTQVCTYYPDRDACQFDSGGPVVYRGSIREFLVGVISYGYACGSNPGVNTRVTSFLNWIQSYPVGNLCAKPFN